ncbi:MAG: glycosyltransferase family 39 protein, partial [Pseudomonadota bacterium]
YSYVFRAAHALGQLKPDGFLDAARFANHLLYLINIFLFFAALRLYFRPFYALLGAFLFAFSPAIYYSGAVVKTESLTLVWILLSLLVAHRIRQEPRALLWHALAAFLSAMAVSTKYNPVPMAIWLCAWTAGEWEGIAQWRNMARNMLFSARPWVFTAVFAVVLLIFGKNALFGQRPDWFVTGEAAFLPFPNFLRSVPGWMTFPYGRWSYGLLFVLPFAAGLWNLVVAFPATVRKSPPREFLWIWGASLAPYFIATTLYTWSRASWFFSPMMPFVIAAGLFLYRDLLESSRSAGFRAGGVLAVFVALGMSAAQYPSNLDMIAGIITVGVEMSGPASEDGQGVVPVKLITNAGVKGQGLNPGHPASDILARQPESVLLLDSYAFNFLKFPSGSEEKKEGEILKELMEGKHGYEVKRKKSLDFFRINLTFDPEASMTYYYLVREH